MWFFNHRVGPSVDWHGSGEPPRLLQQMTSASPVSWNSSEFRFAINRDKAMIVVCALT